MPIEGIKLISHNMGHYSVDDDPSYPYKLEVTLRVPEFLEVTNALLYGNERLVVRAKTPDAMRQFVAMNGFERHCRLISMKITPDLPPLTPVTTEETNAVRGD